MEKVQKIKEELKKCQKLKDEYLTGWKRARADFINYKKEEEKRVKELINYSNGEIILKILEILDNLYIAESKMPEDLKDNQWLKGLLQIKNQILDFLKSQGVEEIKSVGERFNPQFHEAIEEFEAKDKESGFIAKEIKKGYILNGKVIRPSQVKITK